MVAILLPLQLRKSSFAIESTTTAPARYKGLQHYRRLGTFSSHSLLSDKGDVKVTLVCC